MQCKTVSSNISNIHLAFCHSGTNNIQNIKLFWKQGYICHSTCANIYLASLLSSIQIHSNYTFVSKQPCLHRHLPVCALQTWFTYHNICIFSLTCSLHSLNFLTFCQLSFLLLSAVFKITKLQLYLYILANKSLGFLLLILTLFNNTKFKMKMSGK